MNYLQNLLFFSSYLYMVHLNSTWQKSRQYLFGQCTFLSHHWISLSSNCPHAMIVSLYPSWTSFIFFWLCVSSIFRVFFFLCKFHFVQSISYRSIKLLIRVLAHLFFICFLVHFLLSRYIALSFLYFCFDFFHWLSVCFLFLTSPFL